MQTIQIPITLLDEHPANPNHMSIAAFNRLVRNIESTGLYEPLIVRPQGERYQILNGHHRCRALKKLGTDTVTAIVWDVNDEQALTLLATLNRLSGSDDPLKKRRLYAEMLSKSAAKELAKFLPATRAQIEKLAQMKLPAVPVKPAGEFPEPMVFFLNTSQRQSVTEAIASAMNAFTEGTNAEKKAAALEKIARDYIDRENIGWESIGRENISRTG